MEPLKPLRSLIVARMIYPPIGGEFLRTWQNINVLSTFGPVGVFSIFDREVHPPTDSGIVQWQHYNTAHQSWRSRLEQAAQWVRQCGLTYYCPKQMGAVQALDRAIAEFQPHLVILEQLWMIPYLPTIRKHACRIVYDAHNVEVPLYRTTKGEGRGIRALVRNTLHLQLIRASEQTLTRQADQVWVCSSQDRDQLRELYGKFQSFVVSNGVNQAFYADIRHKNSPRPEGEEQTHNVIFTGNFAHLPNAQAAEILITEIYPALKALYPQTRLLLVGRQATAQMQAAAQQDPHILVTGEVADVRPYFAIARTMVVPLQQGSGTRLKILEAFASGCPVVSTAKGAEGLDVREGVHLAIKERADAMVQGILHLWSNPELEQQISDAAYDLLQSHYSWTAVGIQVQTALRALLATP